MLCRIDQETWESKTGNAGEGSLTRPSGPEAAILDSVREIGAGLKQHAQAVEKLGTAIQAAPAGIGRELAEAQARTSQMVSQAASVSMIVGLVLGFVIGRLAAR